MLVSNQLLHANNIPLFNHLILYNTTICILGMYISFACAKSTLCIQVLISRIEAGINLVHMLLNGWF